MASKLDRVGILLQYAQLPIELYHFHGIFFNLPDAYNTSRHPESFRTETKKSSGKTGQPRTVPIPRRWIPVADSHTAKILRMIMANFPVIWIRCIWMWHNFLDFISWFLVIKFIIIKISLSSKNFYLSKIFKFKILFKNFWSESVDDGNENLAFGFLSSND